MSKTNLMCYRERKAQNLTNRDDKFLAQCELGFDFLPVKIAFLDWSTRSNCTIIGRSNGYGVKVYCLIMDRIILKRNLLRLLGFCAVESENISEG